MSQQPAAADWFGLVNLNKPAGWSSRRAVDHVQALVRPAKIGHAGTLDPLASGVLVLCLGQATRLVPSLHALSKTYRAEFLLGWTSATDDTEGKLEPLTAAPRLETAQIEAALPGFVGWIEQVPPAYSAVKLQGQRAYKLARRGQTPDIKPRTVQVESIRLLRWEPPRLELEIVCGSGTYIRSIGRDLAASLGSGGVMSGLTRTAIGPFTLADAIEPEQITPGSLPSQILPAQSALVGMPQVTADSGMLQRLRRGLPATCPQPLAADDGAEIAVCDEQSRLLLIATYDAPRQMLQPRQVFAPLSGKP